MGKSEQNLTVKENERGLIPEWVNPDTMLEIYSRHDDFATTNEEKRASYLREYTALAEYFEKLKSGFEGKDKL